MHNGKGLRLLKVRNPWGSQKWTGIWSDTSTAWTDSLVAELGSTIGEPGVFFIQLEDFLMNFSTTNVCKYEDNIEETHVIEKKPVDNSMMSYAFSLDESQVAKCHHIDILVSQLGDTLSNRKDPNGKAFDPSWFCITVARKGVEGVNTDIKWNWVKSNVSSNYQVILEVEKERLQPGEYCVTVDAIWNKIAKAGSQYRGFTVTLHSNIKIELFGTGVPEKDYLAHMLISKAHQN